MQRQSCNTEELKLCFFTVALSEPGLRGMWQSLCQSSFIHEIWKNGEGNGHLLERYVETVILGTYLPHNSLKRKNLLNHHLDSDVKKKSSPILMFDVEVLQEIYLSIILIATRNSRNIKFRRSLGHQVFLVFLHTYIAVYLYIYLRRCTMLWENNASLNPRNISLLSSLITALSFHSSFSELYMLILLIQNDSQQMKGLSICGFELPVFLFELKSIGKAIIGKSGIIF